MKIMLLFAFALAGGASARLMQLETAAPTPGATFDAQAYRLAITPDFASGTLSGSETVSVKIVGDDVNRLVFSPTGLTIDSATANGAALRTQSTKDATVITLPKAMKAGEALTLHIRFHGKPARGVTFAKEAVYTSYFACDWMFCPQDAPGDKANFDLSLTVPKGMTTLSAGDPVGKRAGPGGNETHRWRANRPYSPYLFGFAAGHFAKVEQRYGRRSIVYLNATGADAPLADLFGQTPQMVAFLEDKAGMPLPAARYTQLLVPGYEAQEATNYALIGTKQVNPVLEDPKADWVIIHELSHQWWGNLITCQSWKDFWLNEGMATFMTAAWNEHRFGRDAYKAELDVARARLKRASDKGWDRPLTFEGKYPSIADRRAIQYSKGALFLDHLRTRLGDEPFWKGIRRFTRDHAGGTVVSADFQKAMEAASGKDLTATFDEWVYRGAPTSAAASG